MCEEAGDNTWFLRNAFPACLMNKFRRGSYDRKMQDEGYVVAELHGIREHDDDPMLAVLAELTGDEVQTTRFQAKKLTS